MNLKEAKTRFFDTRKDDSRLRIKGHAHRDYPDREFTLDEIRALIKGAGQLKDNNAATAKPDSFVWHCNDARDRPCELVVVFSIDANGDLLIVISAFRRVKI